MLHGGMNFCKSHESDGPSERSRWKSLLYIIDAWLT